MSTRFTRGLQFAVSERLQHGHAPWIALGDEGAYRLDLLVTVSGGELW